MFWRSSVLFLCNAEAFGMRWNVKKKIKGLIGNFLNLEWKLSRPQALSCCIDLIERKRNFLNVLGLLPRRCLGSDGRITWRPFGQDHDLVAIMGPRLSLQKGIQEAPRTKIGSPSCSTQLAQIPQTSYLAMVQALAESQASPQRYSRWRWNEGVCLCL